MVRVRVLSDFLNVYSLCRTSTLTIAKVNKTICYWFVSDLNGEPPTEHRLNVLKRQYYFWEEKREQI